MYMKGTKNTSSNRRYFLCSLVFICCCCLPSHSWAWIEGDFVKVWEYYKPPPKPILSSGWLTVSPDPSDATIRIINSSENYLPGMKLKAGRYEIEISSDGYNTIEKNIKVSAGKNINVKIELEKKKKKKKTRRPVITF